jgi:hypothetical protein
MFTSFDLHSAAVVETGLILASFNARGQSYDDVALAGRSAP